MARVSRGSLSLSRDGLLVINTANDIQQDETPIMPSEGKSIDPPYGNRTEQGPGQSA